MRVCYAKRKIKALLLLLCLALLVVNFWDGLSVAEPKEFVYERWNPLTMEEYMRFFGLPNKTTIRRRHFSVWRENWIKLTPVSLRDFQSRSLHQLSLKEPYKSRKLKIAQRCKQHMYSDPFVDLSRLVYDDQHKVVMCVVPKAACSTWKRMLWFMLGKETRKKKLHAISRDIVLGKGRIQTLASLSKAEALRRLATYTTFFVTRHPYHRLVSAHSSKFTNRSSKDFYKKYLGRTIALEQAARHMHGLKFSIDNGKVDLNEVKKNAAFQKLSKSQKKEVIQYAHVIDSGEVTFPQFARYVANCSASMSLADFDVHWRPLSTLCNPCALNYDYVIDFENLAVDSNRLLTFLQRSDAESQRLSLEPVPSQIDDESVSKMFASLDEETKQTLAEIYRQDLKTIHGA